MKRLLLILALCFSLLFLFACGNDETDTGESGDDNSQDTSGDTDSDDGTEDSGESGGNTDTEKNQYKVTVILSEGATLKTENPIKVNEGERVAFYVELENGYLMKRVEGASYFAELRQVELKDVKKDTRIYLTTEKVDYDTNKIYTFNMYGTDGDTASVMNEILLFVGSTIRLNAGADGIFTGWSIGAPIKDGGKLISKEREYSLFIKPDLTDGDVINVYSNYAETEENTVVYNLNGGTVNQGTKNLGTNNYYRAEILDDSVKVTLGAKYFDHIGAVATLFWDDGSFTREGYVLKEYNTLPDGNGESYDPGSKYPIKTCGSEVYCIWEKATDASDFTYETIDIPLPENVTLAKAPHWKTSGIVITSYLGNARQVVIPETIDGKYVIAIAEGAFNNRDMKTLVLPRFIVKIFDGAFVNCASLETVYYPDGIYYVSDNAFDLACWAKLENLYVRASIAPRNPTGDGSFAKKLTRFLANPEFKRVAVVSGSSSFQGLSAGYLEALLGEEWCAVNFGTTRTTHLFLYLALLGYYADEDDILIFAPENSIYEMGEPAFYWKTLRDIEGMYNVFRHVDMTGYTRILTAFAEFNQGLGGSFDRYEKSERYYEELINSYNKYGEYDHNNRHQYNQSSLYSGSYDIRLDKYYVGTNNKLVDVTEEKYVSNMNKVIESAKKNGAFVYFSFAPMADVDINVNTKAGGAEWYDAYEKLITDTYLFDGVLGDAENYIFNVKYFYDNAFHPNDYGRVYRTYRVYIDLCEEVLGIDKDDRTGYYVDGIMDSKNRLVDRNGNVLFYGSMFENASYGLPLTKPDI